MFVEFYGISALVLEVCSQEKGAFCWFTCAANFANILTVGFPMSTWASCRVNTRLYLVGKPNLQPGNMG